jgi:CIC family chloride channel protein
MLAIGIATLIVGDRSIYASQLQSRAESPAHRFRFALPLMSAIPAGDAVRMPRVVLGSDQTVAAARAQLEAAEVPGAPLVDRGGTLRGTVELATLRSADPAAAIGGLGSSGPVISVDDTLDDALGDLADEHRTWAPVVAGGQLVGVLSARDVMSTYRAALAANVRKVSSVGSGGALVEAEIGPTSVLAGKPVAGAAWPRESTLVSVVRGDRVIVPRGDVVLEPGDRLTVFSAPSGRQALEALLASRIAPAAPGP